MKRVPKFLLTCAPHRLLVREQFFLLGFQVFSSLTPHTLFIVAVPFFIACVRNKDIIIILKVVST